MKTKPKVKLSKPQKPVDLEVTFVKTKDSEIAVQSNRPLRDPSYYFEFGIANLSVPARLKTLRLKFDLEYDMSNQGVQSPGQLWTYEVDLNGLKSKLMGQLRRQIENKIRAELTARINTLLEEM